MKALRSAAFSRYALVLLDRTGLPHVTARPPRRTPVRRSYATRIDEPTLFQFVVLSMLVHILAIVLFGTTGRGSAGKGDELLGMLDVRLQRLAPETGSGFGVAPAEKAWSVRPFRPAPEAQPGGSPRAKAREVETIPPPSEAREPAASPVETPVPSEESVPKLNRSAPDEVDKPLRPKAPAAPILPPKIEAAPQSLEPVAPPAIERELAPAIEAPARAIPSAPTAPLERIAPPTVERTLAKPLELPSQAVPVMPSTPLERLAPSRADRELPSPAEPLRELPVEPGAPIEHAAPPAVERQLAPPVDVPPRALPATPAAPIERFTPPTTDRQLAPAAEMPLPRAPVQTPAAESPGPSSAPARSPAAERVPAPAPPAERAPARAPSAEPAPARAPAREPVEREAIRPAPEPAAPLAPRGITPGSIFDRAPGIEPSPPARLGAPSPEEEIFKPRSDRPGESAAPRIDLDAARKRAAREISGSGSTGVLPFPLPVPEKKTKEANAMEKAIKPDCRTAYAGMGLLAVPALVAAAVSENPGCRW
jgi:hypothetical protein